MSDPIHIDNGNVKNTITFLPIALQDCNIDEWKNWLWFTNVSPTASMKTVDNFETTRCESGNDKELSVCVSIPKVNNVTENINEFIT